MLFIFIIRLCSWVSHWLRFRNEISHSPFKSWFWLRGGSQLRWTHPFIRLLVPHRGHVRALFRERSSAVRVSLCNRVFKSVNNHLVSSYRKRQENISGSREYSTSQTFLWVSFSFCCIFHGEFSILNNNICLSHENNLSCKNSFLSFSA